MRKKKHRVKENMFARTSILALLAAAAALTFDNCRDVRELGTFWERRHPKITSPDDLNPEIVAPGYYFNGQYYPLWETGNNFEFVIK